MPNAPRQSEGKGTAPPSNSQPSSNAYAHASQSVGGIPSVEKPWSPGEAEQAASLAAGRAALSKKFTCTTFFARRSKFEVGEL